MNTSITPLPLQFDRPAAPTGWRSPLASVAARVWQALAAAGEARARSRLLDFADRCEALQPELAKELRAASNQMQMG